MNYRPKLNVKDTVYLDRKFSSFSSSFFKPIVATSLLFLLPSLGMGDEYKVDGDGPSISVTTSEGSTPTYLKWASTCNNTTCTTTTGGPTATWNNDSSTWTGTIGSSSTAITSLVLGFDNSNATSFVYNNSSTAAVYASGTNATAINADFAGKSLGTSSSKINLDLKFGSSSVTNGNKNITVSNLDTLYGTLYIRSTATSTSSITENAYTYNITLNTLNGILAVQGSNYFMQGRVTIKSALVGSIYVSGDSTPGTSSGSNSDTAGLTVNFVNGATMTGDILDRANGYAGIRKDIYFTGASSGKTVFTGNIVSFGTGSGSADYLNKYAGNRVYFTQGDMVGYIIASTGQKSVSNGDVSRKGLNVVIFGDSGTTTTQNLTGGILASDINSQYASDTSAQQATNVVVLADNTTLNIKSNGKGENEELSGSFAGGALVGGDIGSSSSSKTYSVTSGSIIARNFGVNEIRIYSNSTLNLNGGSGSIKSVVNDISTSVTNGSALNKINFLSEGGVIQGSIIADNSKNTGSTNKASVLIYVANNASGTITGNLTTEASTTSNTNGRLTVTLGSSNTTSVTGGDVTNNGTNNSITDNSSTLTLQGSSNTITGLTTSAVSGTTNTANLVLDSSNSTGGQTAVLSFFE